MSSIFGVAGDANADLIIFDASKNERRLNEEFKSLQRKLKPKWKFVEYVIIIIIIIIILLLLEVVNVHVNEIN